MWFSSAAKGGADPVFQLLGGEQSRRLCHPLLASQPLGLMTPILLHLLSSNTDKWTA